MKRRRGGQIAILRWRTKKPRRYYDGVAESPELVTMQAIAADVMMMRMQQPDAHPPRGELAGAIALAGSLLELHPQAHDVLERELVRLAALVVRLIEEGGNGTPAAPTA